MADSTPPTRRPLRRVRALLRAFFQIDAELAFRATEEKDHREAQLDRRKWLVGHVVLERAITEPALIPELRSHLDTGLTRAYDRALFQIDAGRPLIPLAEWPDWPERDDTLAADDSYDRMPPRRLRARITSLANRKKEILKELEALLKEDEPQREKKNDQRKIVVGAVLFKRILGKHEETNRLRKLLDNGLSAQRDRELFQLDGDGPLVPKELWSALQVTPAPAAKKRDADAVPPTADAHARSTRSASKRPGRIGPAGSPQAGGRRALCGAGFHPQRSHVSRRAGADYGLAAKSPARRERVRFGGRKAKHRVGCSAQRACRRRSAADGPGWQEDHGDRQRRQSLDYDDHGGRSPRRRVRHRAEFGPTWMGGQALEGEQAQRPIVDLMPRRLVSVMRDPVSTDRRGPCPA